MTTPAAYAAGFDSRFGTVLPELARTVDGLRRRVQAAGMDADELSSAAALDRLPVMSKDDLVAAQARQPPFGGFAAPGVTLRRVFQSPGPLYEPQPSGSDPWHWATALRACGFGPDDLVLNAFGYHLSPAGAMFEEACHAIGATVVPGGVGNLDLQARACADLGVTAYVGLPSYLKALLERADEAGLEPRGWPLERAFVSAEPLPTSLRTWLRRNVDVVQQGYGTAETGGLAYECQRAEGLHVTNDAFVQVCDLTTGSALADGREGQIVATVPSPAYPMLRFGTGDLSAWIVDDDCDCGLRTPRLRGWLGRVDDAVKVRGMFLHPRQVREVMDPIAGIDSYRLVVDRIDDRDVLVCEVVPSSGRDGGDLSQVVGERIRAGLRFHAEVTTVAAIDGDMAIIADVRTWN